MSSHAASRSSSSYMPTQLRRRRHQPFLEALNHITFGHLVLMTPEGGRLEFSGSGEGPAAHLRLYDWHVLDDLAARGETGFAEAYIRGRWASEDLPDLLTFALMNAPVLEEFFHGKPWYILQSRLHGMWQRNSLRGSRQNVIAHYDLGNDFYALWLDKGMTYSCALFEDDPKRTLEEAQDAKYRRILRKLEARPGEHVLDIGCGWGGFAEMAARQDLRVTAITLSEQQAHYARKRLERLGLQKLASVDLIDYRKITGEFDHIVSTGMFEHVGEQYWPIYFATIKKHLKPGGKALIQSITLDDNLFETLHDHTGFMEQVMFPGGMLPSKARFLAAAREAGLECQEMFCFGGDYARTARIWLDRFHVHKDEVKALGYDEEFLRLWRFYLSASIAAFASGRTDVMQAKLMHPTTAKEN